MEAIAIALIFLTATSARAAAGGTLFYYLSVDTDAFDPPATTATDSETVTYPTPDFGNSIAIGTSLSLNANASALANYRKLRALASVQGRAGSTAVAIARCQDLVNLRPPLDGPPVFGSPGHFTATIDLSGAGLATEPGTWGTTAEMDAEYDLRITLGTGTNEAIVLHMHGKWASTGPTTPAVFTGEPVPSGPFDVNVPFTFGLDQELTAQLTVTAAYLGTPALWASGAAGRAGADFSHTFTWLGIRAVFDQDGKPVTGYTLTSASGTDYTRGPDDVVNSPPVARCQDVIVPVGANCSAAASIDAGSSDPDGDAITLSQSPSGPYPVGATTVTLTVTDSHGAASSATATVTVVDDQPPTIVCPPDLCVASDAGSCSASAVNLGMPQTSDNCSVASVKSNAPAIFPLGVTTVTWMVSDTAGNTATCEQKVTVLSSVSITWLPPLAGQPVANKVRVGQVVPHKVDLKDCLGSLPTGVTVSLKVQGIQQTASGEVVFQDVVESADGGLDGAMASDGIVLFQDGHYQFNLDTGNFADPNTANETDKSYRSTVIVTDDATGCELGRSSVTLETRM